MLLGDLRSVADQVDPVGGGRDPLRQHALAEEGVDEAGLARIEFAGHDEEKEAGELVAGLAEAAQIVGVDVAAEPPERGGEPLEQLLLAGPQVLLPLREDRAASQQSADHGGVSEVRRYADRAQDRVERSGGSVHGGAARDRQLPRPGHVRASPKTS